MREPENPFTLRESEQIDQESTFLKLFGHGVLDLITADNFINKPSIILSAPGGGKTSLMRIFNPQSLVSIYSNRDKDDFYRELYHKLQELHVFSESGPPTLLGVYLPCSTNYAELEDLEVDRAVKDRFFFSLLNARLLLSALISLLFLKSLGPSDLEKITISGQSGFSTDIPKNGKDLYDYASAIEVGICRKVGSFDTSLENPLAGVSGLEYFSLLQPTNILFEGKPIVSNLLVMLDDVHILGPMQRHALFKKLEQQRVPIPVWIAERTEALEFNELLPGYEERDFQLVPIERFFKDKGKKYENFVQNVTVRRAAASPFDINFNNSIDDSIDGEEWESRFDEITAHVRKRIERKVAHTKAYDSWLELQENDQSIPREKAIGWKMLEIRIERKLSGGQQTLLNSPLPVEDLSSPSGVKAAAEFLISDEYQIPYYFGLSRLALLSTYNIQQYLGVASDMFEQMISKSIMKKRVTLDPSAQERLIEKIARNFWAGIPTRVPYGTYAAELIQSIGQEARNETRRPTAPYPPGITGIGLTSRYYHRIGNPLEQAQRPEFKTIEKVLHSCIANNLLIADFDYKQGPKEGDTNVVLYLNRLLCVHFKLPLGYGGWMKTSPDDLLKWMGVSKIVW
jgi:hypothetical protein